jgi:hypothetical protein
VKKNLTLLDDIPNFLNRCRQGNPNLSSGQIQLVAFLMDHFPPEGMELFSCFYKPGRLVEVECGQTRIPERTSSREGG